MAAIEIIALQDMAGEQPKLPGGAAALALKARFRQAGFRVPISVIGRRAPRSRRRSR
jgi:hypothetical protein